jgi:manganese/zinc/iron transport system substrate-binding protein
MIKKADSENKTIDYWTLGVGVILSLFTTALFLTGCGGGGSSVQQAKSAAWFMDNGKLKVLCTTEMVHDVVQQVGGEEIDAITLITGELDPHTYEIVKGDSEKLEFAQLIYSNGLLLEHGPSLRQFLEGNDKVYRLGDMIRLQKPELILTVNGMPDPHIWMDIAIWERTIPLIVNSLVQARPEKEKFFRERGEEVSREFLEADRRVRERLHLIPQEKRYLVTSHDAFNYFARSYLAEESEVKSGAWHKRFKAPEGLAPDIQLSLVDVLRIIQHLEDYKIRVLFPEANVSKDSLRKIVDSQKQRGINLVIAEEPLYGDSMGGAGSDGDTYIKMIEHNAKVIGEYLGKHNGEGH